MNKRYFIRLNEAFRQKESLLLEEIRTTFPQLELGEINIFTVFDVFNISEEEALLLEEKVFTVTGNNTVYRAEDLGPLVLKSYFLGIEPVDGQFDQRADIALETLKLHAPYSKAVIKSADLYLFPLMENGSHNNYEIIRSFLLNPIAEQEKDFSDLVLLEEDEASPLKDNGGFLELDASGLEAFLEKEGLAMSPDDIKLVQEEFQKEGRVPTELEMKALDTYWSDHCRHSTFNTEITAIDNQSKRYREDFSRLLRRYEELRQQNKRGDRNPSLMELATIIGRDMRREGRLDRQEVSAEINACSIYVDVENQGQDEPWLLMFKNETHNHPTEMEPFGGAGTCLGGAIRDPLSGRAHVYQALRISGAGDINTPYEETRAGKLPQAYISKTAARGYSDYSNQIGVAGTSVREITHPGYVAKRMELGAVVAATPLDNVLRAEPELGDVVILVGGKTGRDGIGGATGSSKAQDIDSHKHSGAEVQKGNPPVEGAIMRLFRKPEVAKTIRRCNDFGAGGVSVAVGELADSLDIHLDKVPLKYPGLNAMEIAIAESQERMAVLLAQKDEEAFIEAAKAEDLEAVRIAEVTDSGRLRMFFEEELVFDLSRKFIETNGARRFQDIVLRDKQIKENGLNVKPASLAASTKDVLLNHLAEANHGNQEGLAQYFDSTIGRSTVLLPYGGKYQKTEEMASVQTLPVKDGTRTASAMTYGYSPTLADNSPYLMGAYSVIEALAKLTAAGFDYQTAFLTNQEFFKRLDDDREKWGDVFQALLGLMEAQDAFSVAAIGGKDSMSGSFEDLEVPDTLVTFAVNVGDVSSVLSAALPNEPLAIYYLPHQVGEDLRPNYEQLKNNFALFNSLHRAGKLLAASTIRPGGLAETLSKMALGNRVGLELTAESASLDFFTTPLGGLVFALKEGTSLPEDIQEKALYLAKSVPGTQAIQWLPEVKTDFLELDAALSAHLAKDYPPLSHKEQVALPAFAASLAETISADKTENISKLSPDTAEVSVLIPQLYGANHAEDLAAAFRAAGAKVEILVIRREEAEAFEEDTKTFITKLAQSDILALGGSYSLGNYATGAGSYLAAYLLRRDVHEAISNFIQAKKPVLGINNGFQALVYAGFLPGKEQTSLSFALNPKGSHISRMVATKVISNKSPWLSGFKPGEIHLLPISQREGRLIVEEEEAKGLFNRGQVACQFVDEEGRPSMKETANPSGAAYAIEGLLSEDGLVLGKMAHSERYYDGLMQNIPGNKKQDIFANIVGYMKKRG